MAITAAFCNSYKQEILQGVHEAADTYKIALFTSAATLSKSTTVYAATNEVANGNGYTTGGATLSGFSVSLDTDTAILDFTTDPTWPTSTITARGALIYNSTQGDKAVARVGRPRGGVAGEAEVATHQRGGHVGQEAHQPGSGGEA